MQKPEVLLIVMVNGRGGSLACHDVTVVHGASKFRPQEFTIESLSKAFVNFKPPGLYLPASRLLV